MDPYIHIYRTHPATIRLLRSRHISRWRKSDVILNAIHPESSRLNPAYVQRLPGANLAMEKGPILHDFVTRVQVVETLQVPI